MNIVEFRQIAQSGRSHAWQLNSSSCSVYMVIWCFYPLLGALCRRSCNVWRAEEHARSVFWVMSFGLGFATQDGFFISSVDFKTVVSNMYFHVCACIWESVTLANHQSLKAESFTSVFHVKKSRTRSKDSIDAFDVLFFALRLQGMIMLNCK